MLRLHAADAAVMRSTFPTAAAAAVLILCAAPAAASATTTISRTGDVLAVVSTTDGESSSLDLTSTGSTLDVYDTDGLTVTAGPGCVDDGFDGATCDTTGVTKIRVHAGPGDDTVSVTTPLAVELHGEAGDDVLLGDAGNDLLVGGPGADHLSGYGGDDVIDAVDGGADTSIDCATGDDTLDDDPADPFAPGCETVAPELDGTPTLTATAWHAGGSAGVTGLGFSAKPASGVAIAMRWERCSGASCTTATTLSGNDTRYTIQPADVGQTLRFVAEASNRAGKATYTSASSPVIAAAPAIVQVPVTQRPPTTGGIPGGLTVGDLTRKTDQLDIAQVGAQLGTGLDAALKPLGKTRLRAVAAQPSTPVSVVIPADAGGTLTLTWTVPATAARKLGLKAKGKAPVVLATGTARGVPGETLKVKVKPTPAARRALRKARAVKLTLNASLRTRDGVVTATRTVTLRR